METSFNGLGVHLGNLWRLSAARTCSLSAENPTGAKGHGGMATEGTGAIAARELGQGWKVAPCITVPGHQTVTLADIAGPGAIQHIWLTVHPRAWRSLIWRCYWDDEPTPSLDGDTEWPSICGTGTEDYFGGAWCFVNDTGDEYATYSTPFLGLPQVLRPDGHYRSQPRFGMYRWHVQDPIRFQHDVRVTMQALGWRAPLAGQRRYLPLQDDIASTAFWYQSEPHASFPALPGLNALEVI
jgi:hypothetical protein